MPEELDFATFLASQMKDRAIKLAKLSELSGISLKYLEAMTKGDYEHFPAAPYFRGYVKTLGNILGFDPEPWIEWFRREGIVVTSGSSDALPENRFAKKSYGKYIAGLVVAALLIVYAGVRFYSIIGKPQITISNPSSLSAIVSADEIILQGAVSHADTLTVNGEDTPLGDKGVFEKRVILQTGLNSFEFIAKKFLGSETHEVRQVYFEAVSSTDPSISASSTATSSVTSTSSARQ
jgi:Helix-turn-helix domain/Glucodextranase, domain B